MNEDEGCPICDAPTGWGRPCQSSYDPQGPTCADLVAEDGG